MDDAQILCVCRQNCAQHLINRKLKCSKYVFRIIGICICANNVCNHTNTCNFAAVFETQIVRIDPKIFVIHWDQISVMGNQHTSVRHKLAERNNDVVNIIRQFSDAFQSVTAKRAIKQKLRSILWVKYQIKDNDVFDKAYQYIEQYY